MKILINKRYLSSSSTAFFEERLSQSGKSLNDIPYYSNFETEMSFEEIFGENLFSDETTLRRIIVSDCWKNSCFEEELQSASHVAIVNCFIELVKIGRPFLTKTEARMLIGKIMKYFKDSSFVFSIEESEKIISIFEASKTMIKVLNCFFNYRKTLIKYFIKMLDQKNIFTLNCNDELNYKLSYAIQNEVCPNCGENALYGYNHKGEARFFCRSSVCSNFYSVSSSEIEKFITSGIEELNPIRDKLSLFETGENLLQSKIVINNTYVFEKILKLIVSNYNKGLVFIQNDKCIVYTQPMGIKTLKKLMEKVKEIEPSAKLENLRFFNLTFVEELYDKAVQEGNIIPSVSGEIIFDLTTMNVQCNYSENNYTDCFKQSVDENSYQLINCSMKEQLIDTLESIA